MPISAEQCASLLRDALNNRPTDFYDPGTADWFSDVVGIVSAYSPAVAIALKVKLDFVTMSGGGMHSPVSTGVFEDNCRAFIATARSLYTQLRLETNSFTTKQLGKGEIFDYFSEVRDIIRGASQDILFIDPYLDAEFVSVYLPQVQTGVTVRLLTIVRQVPSLKPALELYNKQYGVATQLRAMDKGLHDRHLVIDQRDVYQSGASFKDGGKNAPTSINQIVDVAAEMIAAHEARWAAATVIL